MNVHIPTPEVFIVLASLRQDFGKCQAHYFLPQHPPSKRPHRSIRTLLGVRQWHRLKAPLDIRLSSPRLVGAKSDGARLLGQSSHRKLQPPSRIVASTSRDRRQPIQRLAELIAASSKDNRKTCTLQIADRLRTFLRIRGSEVAQTCEEP